MNERVGAAHVGQWYQHLDKGEMFVVTGIDDRSGAIEVQSFDGDLDEIEANVWNALPLELVETPEDETGPLDVDPEDLGYSETEMSARDWNEPLQPIPTRGEAWEDTTPRDEAEPLAEGPPSEESLQENPAAAERAS
jgi:hypothetical protein